MRNEWSVIGLVRVGFAGAGAETELWMVATAGIDTVIGRHGIANKGNSHHTGVRSGQVRVEKSRVELS